MFLGHWVGLVFYGAAAGKCVSQKLASEPVVIAFIIPTGRLSERETERERTDLPVFTSISGQVHPKSCLPELVLFERDF